MEIGRPPPAPGSVGGAKTKASTPATLATRPWMSCWICFWLRVRSAQSLKAKPAKALLVAPPKPTAENWRPSFGNVLGQADRSG